MSAKTSVNSSLTPYAINPKVNPIVWLDIGGKIFKTRVDTLLKGGQECRFIQDLYPWTYHSNSHIELYYDRDGEHFRYILNYLRNKKLFCPNEPYILNQLLCEASYFKLTELEDELWTSLHYSPKGKSTLNPTSKHISFTEDRTHDQRPLKGGRFANNLEFFEDENEFCYSQKHSQSLSTTYEISSISSNSQQSNDYFERFNLMNDDPTPPPTLEYTPDLGPKEIDFNHDF